VIFDFAKQFLAAGRNSSMDDLDRRLGYGNLAAGMERRPGRSAAVAEFGRAGVLGQASLPAL